MTETLSDKITYGFQITFPDGSRKTYGAEIANIRVEDVREFIKKLKENLNDLWDKDISLYTSELISVHKIIDKIFGEKLC